MHSSRTRLAALAAACFFSLFADRSPVHAQIDRTQNALLWRISGNGLAKPSYLFGTMHVSSKIAFDLNRPFFEALRSADVVALEMDPSSWLGEMLGNTFFRLGLAANAKGTNLPVQGFYEDAFDVRMPSRSNLQQALSSSPELLNSLLYRITDQRRDHEESTYLDLFIFQSSRKMGKSVVGLEDFDDVFSLAMGMMDKGEDDEKERKRRREKLREFTKDGRSTDAILEEAYRNEDLLRIDSLYAVMMPSQAAHDAMLGNRNDGMLENMMPLMGQRSLFAAVGAAHLPGERGLIKLLRDKGYTLEPLTADYDPATTRMRVEMEQRYLPPVLSPYSSDDGIFSMDIPGQLHAMRMGEDISYLATDPVNGTSVMLQRIPRNSVADGLSTDDLMTRLDSLIYAAVPGKIGQRKRVRMPDGSPGFVISSVTTRGHMLHYRIAVTPLEVAILKVSASHPKASKDISRMLASYRFDTRVPPSLQRMEFPAQAVAFDMPAYRVVEVRDRFPLGDTNMGWVDLSAQGVEGDTYYHLMLATLFDHGHLEEDTFELGRFKQRFIDRYGLELINWRHGAHQGRAALRATCRSKDGQEVHAFWTLRGPHYVELALRGSEADAERFISSFAFLPAMVVAEEPYTDGMLEFKNAAPTVNHQLIGNSAMATTLRKAFLNERENKGNEHAFHKQDWLYVSSATNDAVHVSFRRENRYEHFSDTATYWKDRWEEVMRGVPGRVVQRRTWEEEDARFAEGLVVDSTTTRGIQVRFINQAGATWMLQTVLDMNDGPTPWSRTFFSSFAPPDSVYGPDLFSDRTEVFFADILGTDSLRRQQAISSMSTPKFEASHGPRMVQVMKEVDLRKQDSWQRTGFIERIGATGSPAVLPYLTERYRFWSDSTDLQLAVLGALAAHHTKAGTKSFLDLLMEDMPITDGHWSIANAFDAFHDSLELAVPLYPRVLALVRYPEYKPAVLNLLAALVDRKLVKPELYASYKNEFLTDAQAALKRAVSSSPENYYDEEESMTTTWTTTFDATWIWDQERNGPWEDEFDPLKPQPFTSEVLRYAHLLLPWYQETGVKAWFNKVLASKAHDDLLLTMLLLIRSGNDTPTEVVQRYSDDPGPRLWLREQLHRLGRPELFNDAAYTQQDMVFSLLLSGRYRMPGDSISLLEVREGASRFGHGRVHFVRVKYDGGDEAFIQLAGFQPHDSTAVDWDARYVQYVGAFSEEKLKEELDKAMERIVMAGRQRVRFKEETDDQWW